MTYLVFNNRTGENTCSGLEGAISFISMRALVPDGLTKALQNLNPGEYFHIGSLTVVGCAGGVTFEDLVVRHLRKMNNETSH